MGIDSENHGKDCIDKVLTPIEQLVILENTERMRKLEIFKGYILELKTIINILTILKNQHADIPEIIKAIQVIIGLLNQDFSILNDKDISQIIHDINNKLFIISLLEFLEFEKIIIDLNVLIKLNKLKNYCKDIQDAINGEIPWALIGTYNEKIKIKKLEIPEGCVIVIIDDDPQILHFCRKIIEANKGIAITINSHKELYEMCSNNQLLSTVDAVWLDYDLRNGHFDKENSFEIINSANILEPLMGRICIHTADVNDLKSRGIFNDISIFDKGDFCELGVFSTNQFYIRSMYTDIKSIIEL